MPLGSSTHIAPTLPLSALAAAHLEPEVHHVALRSARSERVTAACLLPLIQRNLGAVAARGIKEGSRLLDSVACKPCRQPFAARYSNSPVQQPCRTKAAYAATDDRHALPRQLLWLRDHGYVSCAKERLCAAVLRLHAQGCRAGAS